MEQHPKILLDRIEAVLSDPDGKVSQLGEKGRVLLLRALTAMRVHQTTDDDFEDLPQEVKTRILEDEAALENLDRIEAMVTKLSEEAHTALMSGGELNEVRKKAKEEINTLKATGDINRAIEGTFPNWVSYNGRQAFMRMIGELPFRGSDEANVREVLNLVDLELVGTELVGKNPQDVEGLIRRQVDPNLGSDPHARIVKILHWGVKHPGGVDSCVRAVVVSGGYKRL